MSLIYGFDNTVPINGVGVKTCHTHITFTKYNRRRFVKVFEECIVLLGVSIFSSTNNATDSEKVMFNICVPDGSKMIKIIEPDYGRYFYIIDKNNYDTRQGFFGEYLPGVKYVFTAPRPCSVMVSLYGNSGAGKAPPSPVECDITLHYMESSVHDY